MWQIHTRNNIIYNSSGHVAWFFPHSNNITCIGGPSATGLTSDPLLHDERKQPCPPRQPGQPSLAEQTLAHPGLRWRGCASRKCCRQRRLRMFPAAQRRGIYRLLLPSDVSVGDRRPSRLKSTFLVSLYRDNNSSVTGKDLPRGSQTPPSATNSYSNTGFPLASTSHSSVSAHTTRPGTTRHSQMLPVPYNVQAGADTSLADRLQPCLSMVYHPKRSYDRLTQSNEPVRPVKWTRSRQPRTRPPPSILFHRPQHHDLGLAAGSLPFPDRQQARRQPDRLGRTFTLHDTSGS